MRNPIEAIARWLMTYAFPKYYVAHPEPVDPRRTEIEAWYLAEVRAINDRYNQMHDVQVFNQNRELDAVFFELRRRLAALDEDGPDGG